MIYITLVLFRLIMLHGPEGQEIWINPDAVAALRSKEKGQNFPPGANCLVNLEDGKFAAVKETCAEVRRMGEEK